MRQIVITADDTGGYNVEVPSLPGCYTQRETVEEAVTNAQEAVTLYIEVLTERGLMVPPDDNSETTWISSP